jgi:hypothetical protein
MRIWGYVLVIVGAAIAAWATTIETSVHREAAFQFGSYQPSSDTLNIGLLQNQTLAFHAGLAMFVAGAVLAGAGQINDTLRHTRSHRSTAGDDQGGVKFEGDPELLAAREVGAAARAEGVSLKAVAVALAVGLLFVFAVVQYAPRGAIDNANADALADNLEMQADNLEAAAEAAEEAARR